MSRVGRTPVVVPDAVKVNIQGNSVSVEGPKGKLALDLPADAHVIVDEPGERSAGCRREVRGQGAAEDGRGHVERGESIAVATLGWNGNEGESHDDEGEGEATQHADDSGKAMKLG